MVLPIIIKELFKAGLKYGSRYYKLEGKAFNKLYTGFPQSRTIGRGVRHGLTGGSIVGSLINQDGEVEQDYGIPQKRFRTPSNKRYQTYRRFKFGSRRQYKYCPPAYGRRRRRI